MLYSLKMEELLSWTAMKLATFKGVCYFKYQVTNQQFFVDFKLYFNFDQLQQDV